MNAGVATPALSGLARLAAQKEGEAVVSPGLAGFLVTFALALATVFLIRSMVKHLRKVRYGPGPGGEGSAPSDEFPEPGPRPEDGHP